MNPSTPRPEQVAPIAGTPEQIAATSARLNGAVSASNSQAALAAELARARAALRELLRVTSYIDGPNSIPSRMAAIREAREVLGEGQPG